MRDFELIVGRIIVQQFVAIFAEICGEDFETCIKELAGIVASL